MSIDTDLPMPAKHRWDVLAPFYIDITVEPADIDRLNHVNNAAYLGFMERAAWAHTEALGLDWATYQALDALRFPCTTAGSQPLTFSFQ